MNKFIEDFLASKLTKPNELSTGFGSVTSLNHHLGMNY